ncbi:hypothetical protein AGMMS49992_16830 [Clostridia bacterium]|nr:hypothetical protein AGMMS49992_16830 [Clostridia bacterium]
MMRQYCAEVIELLGSALPDVRITRGYPKTLEKLPCVSVSEAGNLHALFFNKTYNFDEIVTELQVFVTQSQEADDIALVIESAMIGAGFTRVDSRDQNDNLIKSKIIRYSVLSNAGDNGGDIGIDNAICTGIGDVYLARVVAHTEGYYETKPGVRLGGAISLNASVPVAQSDAFSLYIDEAGKEIERSNATITGNRLTMVLTNISLQNQISLGLLKQDAHGEYILAANNADIEYSLRYVSLMSDGRNIYNKYRSFRITNINTVNYKEKSIQYIGIMVSGIIDDVITKNLSKKAMIQLDDPSMADACYQFLAGAEKYEN